MVGLVAVLFFRFFFLYSRFLLCVSAIFPCVFFPFSCFSVFLSHFPQFENSFIFRIQSGDTIGWEPFRENPWIVVGPWRWHPKSLLSWVFPNGASFGNLTQGPLVPTSPLLDREGQKGGFCKRAVLGECTSFCFFLSRRSFFCTLVPVFCTVVPFFVPSFGFFAVQEYPPKTTLFLEPPLLRTPRLVPP